VRELEKTDERGARSSSSVVVRITATATSAGGALYLPPSSSLVASLPRRYRQKRNKSLLL